MVAVVLLTPARSPSPPSQATELRQGRGGPSCEVGARVGGGLRASSPGAETAGAGGGGRVSVVWEAGNAGPGVPFMRGGGRGHGAAVACVAVSGGAGGAGAGSSGLTAAPRGAGALRVGPAGGRCALALWRAGEAGAGTSFGGAGGAAPFLGAGFLAGRAGPFGGRWRCKGGIVQLRRVGGWRREIFCPVWIRSVVPALCRGGCVRWWGWRVVRV